MSAKIRVFRKSDQGRHPWWVFFAEIFRANGVPSALGKVQVVASPESAHTAEDDMAVFIAAELSRPTKFIDGSTRERDVLKAEVVYVDPVPPKPDEVAEV